MLAVSNFWQDVGSQTLGGIIAAIVVLPLAYAAVDRRLHLKDATARRQEREEEQRERRERVLTVLHEELESDAGALQLAMQALGEGKVSLPLFDTTTLEVAFQSGVFEALPPKTVNGLLHVRNRMETANVMHAMVFDFDQGPTAVLAAIGAGAIHDRTADPTYSNFGNHREDFKRRLLWRLDKLAPFLYDAIDDVERELGITSAEPAAQRTYELEDVGP